MRKSALEENLWMYFKQSGLPMPQREYYFAMPRKWRFDFAYPVSKIAIEVEGGIWVQGRHSRGSGMLKDMEKYNEAAKRGWRVLRYASNNLRNAVEDVREILNVISPR